MKTLLLIPSVAKHAALAEAESGHHPVMDYHALARGLEGDGGGTVDLVDYAAVEADTHSIVRAALRTAGKDAALAAYGYVRRLQYDAIFTNGENVGIPLALLLKSVARRPRHVMIGHRLSTGKKRLFFTKLHAEMAIDVILLYATTQLQFANKELGIDFQKLKLIPFHADHRFYAPGVANNVRQDQICAAGLEWRDYPTLLTAVESMPDLAVRLAAASPWSKHTDETANRKLPPNVDARRYEYAALRDLYAQSAFVVVPLYENDFQAGVTTMLEAMAMGKTVIATRTSGQTDVITDRVNGLYVAPGDVNGWREAIALVRRDQALRERLATAAREWLVANASLDRWVANVRESLYPNPERKNL